MCSQAVWQLAFNQYIEGSSPFTSTIAPIVVMAARLTCNQLVTVQICVGAYALLV